MNEEEKEILEQLREKRNKLQEQAPKNIVIQNIKLLGKIDLKRKETEAEKENKEIKKANLYLVEEYDIEKDEIILKYYADDEFIGIDNNGEFLQTGFARENYENTDTIKDVLENLKEKEETQKNSEEKTKQEYSLNELEELEAEQEKEECAETLNKDEDKIKKIAEIKNEEDDKKLAQMSHLQEIDASTMVNNYKNIEKALGLTGVRKFVIVYSEDAVELSDTKEENSSRYSMIAVKDDGTKINLDNKLKEVPFDENNSEKERIQTDADEKTRISNNTASIYKIKGSETNEAFSFEQGQYGEIKAYYGNVISSEKNKFVGDQLETNSVWPTSNKIREHASDRKGRDYAKDKKEEAEKHLEHGDEEVSIENSDGREETTDICESPYVPDTEITWEQLSKSLGDKNVEELQKEFYNQYEGNNTKEIILKMQEEYKEEEKEVEETVAEKEIEDEYEGRVPWDVTKH